jgi:hypothetical protein
MRLFQKHTALTVASLLLILVAIGLNSTKTGALSGNDFNPENIISDSVFYNSNSMSTAQIQQFLNSKLPTCDTDGTQMYSSTQTRAQWAAANGRPLPPYTCLKDYSQSVPTVTNGGSDLCKNSIDGGTKSAAQIIWDSAQACGINPQVLIVMLQKEQSLVTDTWPWPIQYNTAMGYACPDSGPNNSANCNSDFFGFFNQVYDAAKAYRRYEANPTSYNYRAGRNNYVLYKPDTACGGTNIFIENQATASLYIYTPYQPNQSALDNLYGTGDSCSAYGNRNFWRMFNDWFGSTSSTYSSFITGVGAYTDQERTIPISFPVVGGTPIYYRVQARNEGSVVWDNSYVRVGTSNPFNRNSSLANQEWLAPNRPSGLTQDSIGYGDIGYFDFMVIAPNENGVYTESFRLVADGFRWMSYGSSFNINIHVSSPYNASIESITYYTDSDRAVKISPSQTQNKEIYVSIRIKNTGTETWTSNVRVATSVPRNRSSVLFENSWLSNNRLTDLTNYPVGPGGYATAKYTLLAPELGRFSENFTIVADGISWMTSSADYRHSVVYSRDVSRIESSENLLKGEEIRSEVSGNRLVVQGDGNLVLYGSSGVALWSTRTNGTSGNRLVVQGDGNLVLYGSSGVALWSTRTNGIIR